MRVILKRLAFEPTEHYLPVGYSLINELTVNRYINTFSNYFSVMMCNLQLVGMNWGKFKPLLTEAVISRMEPFQVRYKQIMADKGYLEQVRREGQEAAEAVAEVTRSEAKQAMGVHLSSSASSSALGRK